MAVPEPLYFASCFRELKKKAILGANQAAYDQEPCQTNEMVFQEALLQMVLGLYYEKDFLQCS